MAVNRAIKPTKGQGEPLENYVLTTIPKPKASPKNVVVRVVLRPVNPADLMASRQGVWQLVFPDVVAGSEGVGVVDEVGEGVTTVKVGQRVVPLLFSRFFSVGDGSWRDYVEVREIDIVHVPDNISDEVAAQFFVNPWAACGLLKRLQIPKGDYLLQTGAGSVLGRQLITLAKHYGIKTINVVRRDKWIEELTDIGADYVINSTKEDVVAKVHEITGGKGAYGAVDVVASETTKVVASSLRNGGQILVCGTLSGLDVRVNVMDLMRQVSVASFIVNDFSHDLEQRKETVSAVWELLSNKTIDPLIGNTYPLEEFKEAIKETEEGGRGGKVFLSSY